MLCLIATLKFVDTKCDNFCLFIVCVGSISLIINDQEDESIWRILAMEMDCQTLALRHWVLFHTIAFEERLSSFSMIYFASKEILRKGIGQHLYGFEMIALKIKSS